MSFGEFNFFPSNESAITVIVRNAAKAPKGCTVLLADLSDAERMQAIADGIGDCDTLLHIAAAMPLSSVPDEEEEVMMHEAQLQATKNLLHILPATVKHLVYASSIDVYGEPVMQPMTEDHPLCPLTSYGRSKLAHEKLLRGFASRTERTCMILRITQIYGPQEPVIKAIPVFIKTILEGRIPTIFGDGGDLRDYLYVDDAATAIMKAAECRKSDVLNIATGHSVSLAATLGIIIGLYGGTLQPVYQERRKPRLDFIFDVSRAKRLLAFEAATPLSLGLQREYDAFSRRS